MTRILVVEDEEMVRANIVDLLEVEGYETQEASDGEQALQLIWQNPPDLILCDVRMPRVDGFTFLARISQEPRLRAIPFIFLTARVEREDQRLGMNLGADDYITKPFTRKDLLTAVQRRLEKHRHIGETAIHHHAHTVEQALNDLPDDLIAPIQYLLALSQSLMSGMELPGHISQMRELGRDVYKKTYQLLNSARQYVLLNRIFRIEKDLEQVQALRNLITFSAHEVMRDIALSFAQQQDRAADLAIDLEPVSLAMGEEWLVNLLECALGWVFSKSSLGEKIVLQGKNLSASRYEVRLVYTPVHLLVEEYAVEGSVEKTPLPLRLMATIADFHEGSFTFNPGTPHSEMHFSLKSENRERGLFHV